MAEEIDATDGVGGLPRIGSYLGPTGKWDLRRCPRGSRTHIGIIKDVPYGAVAVWPWAASPERRKMTLREYLIAYLAAYPESIFPPVEPYETASLLGLSDRIAAHQSRIILGQILKDLDTGVFSLGSQP